MKITELPNWKEYILWETPWRSWKLQVSYENHLTTNFIYENPYHTITPVWYVVVFSPMYPVRIEKVSELVEQRPIMFFWPIAWTFSIAGTCHYSSACINFMMLSIISIFIGNLSPCSFVPFTSIVCGFVMLHYCTSMAIRTHYSSAWIVFVQCIWTPKQACNTVF